MIGRVPACSDDEAGARRTIYFGQQSNLMQTYRCVYAHWRLVKWRGNGRNREVTAGAGRAGAAALISASYYYQSYMRLDRHYKQHRVSIE